MERSVVFVVEVFEVGGVAEVAGVVFVVEVLEFAVVAVAELVVVQTQMKTHWILPGKMMRKGRGKMERKRKMTQTMELTQALFVAQMQYFVRSVLVVSSRYCC